MKKVILSITALAAVASAASAATTTYNDSTGSYTGYEASSPFFSTFGAITQQDPNPVAETTSVYDFRGLGSTVSAGATYFFLEDFQDGQADAPGFSYAGGSTNIRTNDGRNGSANKTTSDVAEDTPGDGALRFESFSVVTFTFDSVALGGNLPTYFGFAFPESFNGDSDYARTVIAYDSDNNVIGNIDNTGGIIPTAVPFFGFQTDVGISYVEIGMNAAGESDHFQYGYVGAPVPEPSSFALLAGMFGLTWVMIRRRS